MSPLLNVVAPRVKGGVIDTPSELSTSKSLFKKIQAMNSVNPIITFFAQSLKFRMFLMGNHNFILVLIIL